jgi:hypothetical protein
MFDLNLPDLGEQTWSSRLIWSNLYKIAPAIGGNPNSRLKSLQFRLCLNLLDVEIRTFRPKNIVFATGDWANTFVNDNPTFQSLNWEASSLVRSCGDFFVDGERIGRFVVADHPQGKEETIWVNSVLGALQRSNSQ